MGLYTGVCLSPDFWYANEAAMAKKRETIQRKKRKTEGKEIQEEEEEEGIEAGDQEDQPGSSGPRKGKFTAWFEKLARLIGDLRHEMVTRFSCVETDIVEMREARAAERQEARLAREEEQMAVAMERSQWQAHLDQERAQWQMAMEQERAARLAAEAASRHSMEELRTGITALHRDFREECAHDTYRRRASSATDYRPPTPAYARPEDWDWFRPPSTGLQSDQPFGSSDPTEGELNLGYHFQDPQLTSTSIDDLFPSSDAAPTEETPTDTDPPQ